MDLFTPQLTKLNKTLSFQKNTETEFSKSNKLLSSIQKISDDEKGFVFSLNQFKPKQPKISSIKVIEQEQPFKKTQTRTSIDQEQQNKRKIIYGSESYKERQEEGTEEVVQKNTSLFQMVFLNNKKGKSQVQEVSISHQRSVKENIKIDEAKKEQPHISTNINDFQLGKKLGSGKFGEVFIAKHKATGFLCAIKKIAKKTVVSKLIVQLVRQIKIQSFLNNPNIVKMYTFFSDTQHIYLVLQLCYSGQLYKYMRQKRRIPQQMTRNIVQQICKALDYMHYNQIIHRDLKPQNVIYHGGLVKLCDFGWSISTNTMRQTFCGTPIYISPELLKRKTYNNKIDVWSVGILTYELLFGRVPFEITTDQDFVKIVPNCLLKIEDEIKFSKVTKTSDQAKDFILICLQKDPRDRFTLPELLQHPFLTKIQNISMVELY